MTPVPTQRTWTPGELATAATLNSDVRNPVNFYRQRPMNLNYLIANQSITPTDTWVLVDWSGGELVDSEGGGSGGVITVVRSGLYDISMQGLFDTNTTGGRALKCERTTPGLVTTVITETGMISSCSTDFPGIANVETTVRLCDPGYYLDAGDTLRFYARQTSGGALNLDGHATEQYTWCCVRWVASS